MGAVLLMWRDSLLHEVYVQKGIHIISSLYGKDVVCQELLIWEYIGIPNAIKFTSNKVIGKN